MADGGRTTHDSADKWTVFPDWAGAFVERDGWMARPATGLWQVVVSGDVAAVLAAQNPAPSEVGLWAIAEKEAVAARIARDRMLLISPQALDIRFGWNDGWAASPADDAWFVIDLEGSKIESVVREATMADLDTGSRSAAVLFAGVRVLLYRHSATHARLHVEMGQGPYLWRWLEDRRG